MQLCNAMYYKKKPIISLFQQDKNTVEWSAKFVARLHKVFMFRHDS